MPLRTLEKSIRPGASWSLGAKALGTRMDSCYSTGLTILVSMQGTKQVAFKDFIRVITDWTLGAFYGKSAKQVSQSVSQQVEIDKTVGGTTFHARAIEIPPCHRSPPRPVPPPPASHSGEWAPGER
ncbi:hypothetical protein ACROYT_G036661 [Oculina patagonica]